MMRRMAGYCPITCIIGRQKFDGMDWPQTRNLNELGLVPDVRGRIDGLRPAWQDVSRPRRADLGLQEQVIRVPFAQPQPPRAALGKRLKFVFTLED